jgi:hypothetical protein
MLSAIAVLPLTAIFIFNIHFNSRRHDDIFYHLSNYYPTYIPFPHLLPL